MKEPEGNHTVERKKLLKRIRGERVCWYCPPNAGENFHAPPKHGSQKPKYIIGMNPLEWTDKDYEQFFDEVEKQFGPFEGADEKPKTPTKKRTPKKKSSK